MNKLLWFLAVHNVSCAYSVSNLAEKETSPSIMMSLCSVKETVKIVVIPVIQLIQIVSLNIFAVKAI